MISVWLFIFWLSSSALLAYLAWQVSPFSDYPHLNYPVIVLFFVTMFVSAGSLFSMVALRLHQKWPLLAGADGRAPKPIAAVRQGFLFSLALVIIGLLALLQMLDIIFALVTFLLVGLLEGLVQSQE